MKATNIQLAIPEPVVLLQQYPRSSSYCTAGNLQQSLSYLSYLLSAVARYREIISPIDAWGWALELGAMPDL